MRLWIAWPTSQIVTGWIGTIRPVIFNITVNFFAIVIINQPVILILLKHLS